MESKWDNKQCPICLEGTLHEGNRQKSWNIEVVTMNPRSMELSAIIAMTVSQL